MVHAAYLHLVGGTPPNDWDGRRPFFAAAARAVRAIPVDRARREPAEIPGGGRGRAALHKIEAVTDLSPERQPALDEALARLSAVDPVAGRLVHLRSFAGLAVEEAAGVVGRPRATAYRHWAFARTWLVAQATDGTSGIPPRFETTGPHFPHWGVGTGPGSHR